MAHEIIIMENPSYPRYHFEVVDIIPLGYVIWNIGDHMVPGYLPLCRLAMRQPFPGGRNIETDTLKAIRCNNAQVVMKAVGHGPDTLEAMEAALKKPIKRESDRQDIEKAVEILRTIWRR